MPNRTGRKVCLFAQYDPDGRVRPHVPHYLRALRDAGYALHVAIASPAPLGDADAEVLHRLGAYVLVRPNAGLDFGAWRDLLRDGRADGATRVLLANDSVYGPLAPLAPTVARMEARGLDAWGMVESREHGRHLQSWFLDLSADALARPAVARVFDQPFEAMGKREIVVQGELALGAAMRSEGLTFTGVAVARGVVNPMHYGWRAMLRAGVPFIKAELVRDNPWRIGWAGGWRREVERRGYPAAWIDEALGAPPGGWRTPVPPLTLSERLYQLRVGQDRGAALAALFRPRPPQPVAAT